MPLIPTAQIVREARAARHAACAFNVITLEHAEAIVAGATGAGRPVICQLSENAVRFHGGALGPISRGMAVLAQEAPVPVALHLDHVTDDNLLRQAAEWGYGSVMYDASARPYPENAAATATAASWAHDHGLWLEAELGEIGGKDGAHAPGARTDPVQARAFVDVTGVDALAVAVGSSHAMTSRGARLDHDLITRLHQSVPVPLVLHGSTGVPEDELHQAIAHGMVKINFGTALNIAFSGQVRAWFAEESGAVDPRPYLRRARNAMTDVVTELLAILTVAPGPGW